jgi:hypothetical protein
LLSADAVNVRFLSGTGMEHDDSIIVVVIDIRVCHLNQFLHHMRNPGIVLNAGIRAVICHGIGQGEDLVDYVKVCYILVLRGIGKEVCHMQHPAFEKSPVVRQIVRINLCRLEGNVRKLHSQDQDVFR